MLPDQARALRSPAFWVVGTALAIAVAANWNSDSSNRSASWGSETPGNGNLRSDYIKGAEKGLLLREDSNLSQIRGRFTTSHQRVVFQEEGVTKTLKCLENLWLQRILDAQKNSDKKVVWLIDARVTEFGGENYLLIESASKTR